MTYKGAVEEAAKQMAQMRSDLRTERDEWKSMYYSMTAKRDALEAKLEKLAVWFEKQADIYERNALDTRFQSIVDASKQDAKNMNAIAADIRKTITAEIAKKGK